MPDIPFGFALPGGQPPDPNDPAQMQQFMSQLQHLLSAPGSGPVNWDLARQVAASQLSAAGDPAVSMYERNAVEEALRLADLWLEPASAWPSGIQNPVAWNRNEWIFKTLDVWRKLCDPVASRMVGAMGDLVPPEARAQLGPMQSMVASLGGALFGGQLGQALGSLAAEVLSAGDIGLPLGPAGTAALIPANIRAYGEGLELPEDEVRLYVALREAAHQRLFQHVPWLRGHVLSAVEMYASGIRVNREAIEEAMGRVDPTDPESMQAIALEGIFTPEDTPAQKASLARLETALALVEGWVCHVVDNAASDRLPNVVRLGEAFRRRRAAGGPAEQTFAALVGLELRPRRLREAAALWAALTQHRGIEGRDAVWGHPDLLPSDDDFADPVAFAMNDMDLSELDSFDFTAPGGFEEKAPGQSGESGQSDETDGEGDAKS
ncbi:zinc-dependent metalloprotease [Micromonospora foliorum]|uniref:zinc-dependent metalloprotease n=1 Tax=Micromonospora foliorum TaxID=2911210 RepID=UPI001EE946A3|nr:zinc-dependent metalloprotease [Micromonospora foliorum]MCG5439684.1 zinc-dependent metalloprotease [Micromonospora foliorum]